MSGGMRWAGLGIAVGLSGALIVNRLLEARLFGVQPTSPWAFLSAAAVLSAIVVAACYMPARRMARIDPVVALRCD